jgi:hypothetical protein
MDEALGEEVWGSGQVLSGDSSSAEGEELL